MQTPAAPPMRGLEEVGGSFCDRGARGGEDSSLVALRCVREEEVVAAQLLNTEASQPSSSSRAGISTTSCTTRTDGVKAFPRVRAAGPEQAGPRARPPAYRPVGCRFAATYQPAPIAITDLPSRLLTSPWPPLSPVTMSAAAGGMSTSTNGVASRPSPTSSVAASRLAASRMNPAAGSTA